MGVPYIERHLQAQLFAPRRLDVGLRFGGMHLVGGGEAAEERDAQRQADAGAVVGGIAGDPAAAGADAEGQRRQVGGLRRVDVRLRGAVLRLRRGEVGPPRARFLDEAGDVGLESGAGRDRGQRRQGEGPRRVDADDVGQRALRGLHGAFGVDAVEHGLGVGGARLQAVGRRGGADAVARLGGIQRLERGLFRQPAGFQGGRRRLALEEGLHGGEEHRLHGRVAREGGGGEELARVFQAGGAGAEIEQYPGQVGVDAAPRGGAVAARAFAAQAADAGAGGEGG
jgi:hypothetical protein